MYCLRVYFTFLSHLAPTCNCIHSSHPMGWSPWQNLNQSVARSHAKNTMDYLQHNLGYQQSERTSYLPLKARNLKQVQY